MLLVWVDGTLEGAEGIGRVAQAINQRHGLNFDVRFISGPGMSTMLGRVAQEYQAGRTAATDVFVGYANNVLPPLQADALEVVDRASWDPHVQDARSVAPGGVAVAMQSSLPGLTYDGEFDVLALTCSQGPSLEAQAQGAPIGTSSPPRRPS